MVAFSTFLRISFVSAACMTKSVSAVEVEEDPMELPDIDAVLEEAAGTQDEFAAQVGLMQAHVEKQQQESTQALAEKKVYFERKLATQADQTSEILTTNDELRANSQNLRKGNLALLADTKQIRAANRLLRGALKALNPKMQIANEFLDQALRLTDSSNSTEALKVLEPPIPAPTLDHFLDVIREGSKEPKAVKAKVAGPQTGDKLSLLEVHRGRRTRGHDKQSPEELVPVLSQGLDKLSAAQDEGVARLKAQYLAQFEVGEKKQVELMQVQQDLRDGLADLQARQQDLHKAKALSLTTNEELEKRIQGIRVFVQKADTTVADAIKHAHEIIKAS